METGRRLQRRDGRNEAKDAQLFPDFTAGCASRSVGVAPLQEACPLHTEDRRKQKLFCFSMSLTKWDKRGKGERELGFIAHGVSTHFVIRLRQNQFCNPSDQKIHRELRRWLPGMESNHDKTSQSRLCYHYTTRQWKYSCDALETHDRSIKLEPAMGFEPATACLQNRCSTVELRRQKSAPLAVTFD